MGPIAFLATRTLARSAARSLLVVLGLSVTGALLLDMTMLAGGLEASLGAIMTRLGFAVRVVPHGTLPFEGDAEIVDGDHLAAAIAAQPGVAAAVPILGTNVYVRRGPSRFPSFALGVPGGTPGMYAVFEGSDLPAARPGDPPVVINRTMAQLDGVKLGDTLVLSGVPGPYLQTFAALQPVHVIGIADFYFDLSGQRSLAIPTPFLRRLRDARDGSASVILVRMTQPRGAEALARWIAARDPRVDAFSIPGFLARAGRRLTYFNQFSLVLGTISVAVSFLLITTIVTLSVGERLGEIAMLRALGFSRARIGTLVLAEGIVLAAAALPGAFILGVAIAGYLDGILRSAPGVPQGLHFFTLTAGAVTRTALLLLGTGALGGVYPAMMAARQGIAATLHREVLS